VEVEVFQWHMKLHQHFVAARKPAPLGLALDLGRLWHVTMHIVFTHCKNLCTAGRANDWQPKPFDFMSYKDPSPSSRIK